MGESHFHRSGCPDSGAKHAPRDATWAKKEKGPGCSKKNYGKSWRYMEVGAKRNWGFIDDLNIFNQGSISAFEVPPRVDDDYTKDFRFTHKW